MQWALLCALVPWWVPGGLLFTQGELCRAWAAENAPRNAFSCPRKRDSAAATFCCGTCRRPYCCAGPEDRLDQPRCADQPPPQPQNQPDASTPPFLQILVPMAWFCSGTLAFVLGFAGLRYLYLCLENCLRSLMEGPHPVPMDEITDRSPRGPAVECPGSPEDPPPSYSACVSTGLPSFGAGDRPHPRSLPSTLDHEMLVVQFRRGTPETPGMG